MMVMCPSFRNQCDSSSLWSSLHHFRSGHYQQLLANDWQHIAHARVSRPFQVENGSFMPMSGLWFPNIFNFPFYGRSISRTVPPTYWMVVFSTPVFGGWPSGVSGMILQTDCWLPWLTLVDITNKYTHSLGLWTKHGWGASRCTVYSNPHIVGTIPYITGLFHRKFEEPPMISQST